MLGRDDWEVIRLEDGDEVVGAVELTTGRETLCFVTSDAQLLHFGADGVRPQGRSGGGIAGVRLTAGERVAWFGAVDPDAPEGSVVVTASGSSTALPGTEPGAVKVAPFTRVPRQGPRHRRRALPPLPQGRGHPGLRLGRHGARAGGRRQRAPDRPARGHRPARRLRRPGQPADRGLRRAGRARGVRVEG